MARTSILLGDLGGHYELPLLLLLEREREKAGKRSKLMLQSERIMYRTFSTVTTRSHVEGHDLRGGNFKVAVL